MDPAPGRYLAGKPRDTGAGESAGAKRALWTSLTTTKSAVQVSTELLLAAGTRRGIASRTMSLTEMQLLRCWETNYGRLSASLVLRFLSHPATAEICSFPAPFVLQKLKTYKKLASLLDVRRIGLADWERSEQDLEARKHDRSRMKDDLIADCSEDEREGMAFGLIEMGYLVEPSDLEFFYDYFFSDDGPSEFQ